VVPARRAAAANETSSLRLVAVLTAPLVLVTVLLAYLEPDNALARLALGLGFAGLAYSGSTMWLARRTGWGLPIFLVNTGVFACLATGLLVAASIDSPRASAHEAIFGLYLLLVATAALIHDPRIALAGTLFSLVGFGVWVYAVESGGLPGPLAMEIAARQDWVLHGSKAAILLATGMATTIVASRGMHLQHASLCDGLTGLLNRHAFDACLRWQAERARQLDRPLSVAMIDVDHFKRLNDHHGHAVGDAVLRGIAGLLESAVRATDLVTRYGGDEFVVAFLDTDHARLDDRLEEFRARVRATSFGPEEIGVSISIGIARVPAEADGVELALRKADERLYAAKRAGRDRLVT
jgi:diguanylate cyclase (GGDEF)-like protein